MDQQIAECVEVAVAIEVGNRDGPIGFDHEEARRSLNEDRERLSAQPIVAPSLVQGFLACHPDHPEANFDMGRLLLTQQEDGGRAFLDRAAELFPDHAAIYFYGARMRYRFLHDAANRFATCSSA